MNCIDFDGDELTGVDEAKQYLEDVVFNKDAAPEFGWDE